jgi:hypothetical protein
VIGNTIGIRYQNKGINLMLELMSLRLHRIIFAALMKDMRLTIRSHQRIQLNMSMILRLTRLS